ncbi:mediator of RNA polymerase II transcription subunit 15 isoform X2 [Lingula anatina]|uniref:Mediator of RNA polymerase II transcription subunit 15 n=1 Tax=Lingula anatina TaxID=7574 RepID=A0A1S3I257_LINAN|nr:mediator of RNA polymerase II transcription subunit 15 isoform X2 [Lingula anatina]|eukprot:XP_013392352.1 mediator of RNA polymerase II transcription subunit 15 isoform X2 [Lingula anatina]
MAEKAEDWRTQQFRQKVIIQIDEAVRHAGSPTSKSPYEMENHVFQKAKTRDEYLALVARLIIHVREMNSKKEKAAQQAAAGGAMMTGGMHPMGGGGQAPIQDPINALQNLAKTGVGTSMGPQQMAQGPMANRGQVPMMQQMMVRGMSQQQDVGRSPQMTSPPVLSPLSRPSSQVQSPYSVQNTYGQVSQQQQSSSVPSPAVSSIQPVHSPANPFASPSPGPGSAMAPSPASRVSFGAPSPGGISVNTPGNPGSVGPAPSPALRSAEDQAYLDKLKQLSKYIEPLRRMINKIDKDEDRKKDLSKMKSLLEILSDSNRRLPMQTLLKCEQVLEKLELLSKPSSSSSTSVSSSSQGLKLSEQHMCQPLLDTVAQFVKSPTLNHTLERTFGPALDALHGPPIRGPSPPPKRFKPEEDKEGEVPNVIQGEIARLARRFKVDFDPMTRNGEKTLHFICKLDDKNLPSVPPLSITVPAGYPETSPECDTALGDYESTPFLQNVQKSLDISLTKMPNRYSITALLDTWEMSVRQACNPDHATQK